MNIIYKVSANDAATLLAAYEAGKFDDLPVEFVQRITDPETIKLLDQHTAEDSNTGVLRKSQRTIERHEPGADDLINKDPASSAPRPSVPDDPLEGWRMPFMDVPPTPDASPPVTIPFADSMVILSLSLTLSLTQRNDHAQIANVLTQIEKNIKARAGIKLKLARRNTQWVDVEILREDAERLIDAYARDPQSLQYIAHLIIPTDQSLSLRLMDRLITSINPWQKRERTLILLSALISFATALVLFDYYWLLYDLNVRYSDFLLFSSAPTVFFLAFFSVFLTVAFLLCYALVHRANNNAEQVLQALKLAQAQIDTINFKRSPDSSSDGGAPAAPSPHFREQV